MNKVKRSKTSTYITISNVFLRDKALSVKAKGFLAVVMGLPDDWDFTIKGVCVILKEGKTAVYGIIQELKAHGYCTTIESRDDKGLYLGVDYTFYEEPTNSPQQEQPHSDFGDTDNQPQLNTYRINKEEIKERTNILSYISKESKGLDPSSEVAPSHSKSAVVPLEERKQAFMDKVYSFSNVYDRRLLDNFIDYWTECGGRKMRFEKEKTYELALRLKTWKRNEDERQARYQPKYKSSVPASNESKSDGYPQAVNASDYLKKIGI